MKGNHRQGDVLLVRKDKVDTNEEGKATLALGEVTDIVIDLTKPSLSVAQMVWLRKWF